jgi:hypothetical protein
MLEDGGGQFRGGDRQVAVASHPQAGGRRQRDGPAGHSLADHDRGNRDAGGRDRDEQLGDRRPDPGRLVAWCRGGARSVDQRQDRPPEARRQREQARRRPEPGRCRPLPRLRDVRDRGAVAPAEAAAQAGVHPAAPVAADLEGLLEVARQPLIRASPAPVARAADLRPGVMAGTTLGAIAGRPAGRRRTIRDVTTRLRRQQPDDHRDLVAEAVRRRQRVDGAAGPLAVGEEIR